jgi:hypothetical protein
VTNSSPLLALLSAILVAQFHSTSAIVSPLLTSRKQFRSPLFAVRVIRSPHFCWHLMLQVTVQPLLSHFLKLPLAIRFTILSDFDYSP